MLTVARIDPWQGSSPNGGFIYSTWQPARKLALGDVIRTCYGWQPITGLRCPTTRVEGYLIVHVFGEWRWRDGAEVRTDVRVDLDTPVLPCGCWKTVDGSWTCDEHLALLREIA